jgi:hypothetical protein
MKITYVLISMLLFAGCVHRSVPHVALANQQMHSFVKEMFKEKQLYVSGAGGSMMNDIKKLSIDFDSYDNQKLSVAEARKLIVEITEKFIDEINCNEKIRPYLSKFPVDCNNVLLAISFFEKPHIRVPDEFVGLLRQKDGMIYYAYYDAKEHRFKNGGYRERYEDALRIVKESQALP